MMSSIWSQRLFRVGLVLLGLGTGPLLLILVLDPKANPILPGLMAMLTFWPSIGLIVAGVVMGVRERMAAGQEGRGGSGGRAKGESSVAPW